MNIKKIIALISAAVILNMASGCSKSCEICDEVVSLRNDITKCREILNASEVDGSKETLDTEKQLTALLGQYATLSKHECDAEVENVKNMEYDWIEASLSGKYTGEWKSFCPCGTGSYTGSDPYSRLHWDSSGGILEYTGEWEYGVPNGHGEYAYYQEKSGVASVNMLIEYEGEFVNGKFDGQGTLTVPYGLNSYFNVNMLMIITGTFSDGGLTGNAGYVVYDGEGNLYDRGYVDKSRVIIQSDRADQHEKEVEQQTKDILGDIGRGIFDMLF